MFHVKQWMKVPVKSEKMESLNAPEENFGKNFYFLYGHKMRKRRRGSEKINQEISQKGFSKIVKKRKVLEFIPVDAIECYCGFRVLFLSPKKYRKMFHVKQRGKWPTVSGKIAGLDSRKKFSESEHLGKVIRGAGCLLF